MLLFSTDYPHYQFEGDRPIPEGLDEGIGAEDHGGEPAAYLCSTERKGDHAMNVDVLNRSGLQAALDLEAGDRRLRHSSSTGRGWHRRGQQVALSVSCRSGGWIMSKNFGIQYRQPWEKGRHIRKGQPQACRRDAFTPDGGSPAASLTVHGGAASGPEQRRAGDPESADRTDRARPIRCCRLRSRMPRTSGRRPSGRRRTSGCVGRWWCRMRMRLRR